jgi:hypothetical protein
MNPSAGGLALSYHAQISAHAAQGLIVGVAITREADDTGPLLPALERIAERWQRKPEQMVADAGYTTGAAIEEMAERKVDFPGSLPPEDAATEGSAPQRLPPSAFLFQPETNRQVCPEGKFLRHEGCLPEGARAGFPPLYGEGGALSKLCPQTRVLSGKSQRRPGDIALGGERCGSGFPAEDGNRRSTGELSSAWESRGILPCLDQK